MILNTTNIKILKKDFPKILSYCLFSLKEEFFPFWALHEVSTNTTFMLICPEATENKRIQALDLEMVHYQAKISAYMTHDMAFVGMYCECMVIATC